jgi:hypothetical protein
VAVDEITAALKPVNSKDIESGQELTGLFKWFKENLATQPGKLGELYQLWNGHPASKNGPRGWAARPWNPEDDRMLAELGGIDFGPMLADVERFANLSVAGDELRTGAEQIRKRLQEAWSGPAAEAALERLDMLVKGAGTFRDTLNQFAAALDAARSTTREAIGNVRAALQDRIKPFDVPEGVDFRRGQIDRINAAMSGQDPYGHPWAPDELRRPATVDLNQGSFGHWWSNESINALDAVCDSYLTVIGPLRRLIGETTMAINASWHTLNDLLGHIQADADLDPFGKAAPQQMVITVSSPDRVGLAVGGKKYEVDFAQPTPGQAQAPPANSDVPAGGAPAAGVPAGGGAGPGSVGQADAAPLQQGLMTGAQVPASSDMPDKPAGAAPMGMATGGPAGGGGMPMGGMAGMGAGGGQGGDSERKDAKWRTQGDLFDDAVQIAVPMVIGDHDPYGAYGKDGP